MKFQKGNKLASVQKGKPKAKTQAWNNIVGWLVGDGGTKFKELINDLSNGIEITKEQKEFLGHYKDLLEYHQPKLARNIGHQEIDHTITFKWDEQGNHNTIQAKTISEQPEQLDS